MTLRRIQTSNIKLQRDQCLYQVLPLHLDSTAEILIFIDINILLILTAEILKFAYIC